MRQDIVTFLKKANEQYGFESYYMPSNDCFVVTKKGRAIQNFSTKDFYAIPPIHRMREYRGLLMGLSRNLGEKHKNQFFLPRKLGIKIV